MPTERFTQDFVAAIPLPTEVAQVDYWDEETRGLYVRVGRSGARTFGVMRRINGKKTRVTIGVFGQQRKDGQRWSVQLARKEAEKMIGSMANGAKPSTPTGKGGPTLRFARDVHIANMRKKGLGEKSIANVEYYTDHYVPELLDLPISQINGETLAMVHERVKNNARQIAGIVNTRGAATANKVITTIGACWNSLNRLKQGALGTWNPAKAVTQDKIKPKRARVDHADLPDWWRKVQTIENEIRRDLQTFMMFSAMRDTAATHVRWDDLELHHAPPFLRVPDPKRSRGEAKPFELPLGPTLVALFERRKRNNEWAMKDHGGDDGWVFPTVTRSGGKVIPIAESKEQRWQETKGKDGKPVRRKVQFLPGPHTLRRTFLSVATEAGITELDRHVLANHAFGTHNVNASYIRQHLGHLHDCQRKIDAEFCSRMKVKPAAREAVDDDIMLCGACVKADGAKHAACGRKACGCSCNAKR